MTINNELTITLFLLIATSLALGYGFGVKAQRFPFTAEIGFSDRQWQFLKWWVNLSRPETSRVDCWIGARSQKY